MNGIGVDIVSIKHLEERFSDTFKQGVFTDVEIAYADEHPRPLEAYAGTFAGKEAVVKALSEPWSSPRDIEIIRESGSCPAVALYGPYTSFDTERIHVTLSADDGYAIAFAVYQ